MSSDGDDDAALPRTFQGICSDVRRHLKEQERLRCEEISVSRNEQMMAAQKKRPTRTPILLPKVPPPPHPVLCLPVASPASAKTESSQSDDEVSWSGSNNNNETKRQKLLSGEVKKSVLPRKELDRSAPRSVSYIPIQASMCVPGGTKRTFVPYMGRGFPADDVGELLLDEDKKRRQDLVDKGIPLAQKRTDLLVDEMLKQCSSETESRDGKAIWENDKVISILADAVQNETGASRSYIQERLQQGPFSSTKPAAKPEIESLVGTKDEVEYMKAQDTYRVFFCRQCLTLGCNLHGQWSKPSLAFQTKRLKEKVGTMAPLGIKIPPPSAEVGFNQVDELSDHQKIMCRRHFVVFEGDVHKISMVMRVPRKVIEDFIQTEGLKLKPEETAAALKPPPQKKANTLPYYSLKNYQRKWYKAIKEAEIHPLFTPCIHDGECSVETCSCVQNHTFCTLACCWGSSSPNFFRGCGCESKCNTNSCTCFSFQRECDPDLCNCGTCCDPLGEPAKDQLCRNDNVQMRRSQLLHVGRSKISGWGLFCHFDLKKGDYIQEYVGELISQEEGERRGQLDDAKNQSYLFNLSSDYSIDAKRMGNNARFINHSDTPNCFSKVLFVKGEQKIAFFALQDIPAQTELTFDYRYNAVMDNDLISKEGKAFPWMKLQGSEGDKKPAASGKRATRK